MPRWYDLAKKEVGTKEVPGKGANRKILQYYKDAGHPWVQDDAVAWCAAFANAMLIRAGHKGTGKLTARSFLQWGQKIRRPKPGCIVVFARGKSSWQGHVGFFVKEDASYIYVLGGNQSNAVNIKRFSKRSKSMPILGYRWPYKSIARSKTAVSAVGLGAMSLGSVADNLFLGEQVVSSIKNMVPEGIDPTLAVAGVAALVVAGLVGWIVYDRYRRGQEHGF